MRPRLIRDNDNKLANNAKISRETAHRLKVTKHLINDFGYKLSNADDTINLALDRLIASLVKERKEP
jgi:hypothetical protein